MIAASKTSSPNFVFVTNVLPKSDLHAIACRSSPLKLALLLHCVTNLTTLYLKIVSPPTPIAKVLNAPVSPLVQSGT